MRLTKKPKDVEGKKEIFEGLSRMVCTSRNPATPFNGNYFIKYFIQKKK